MKKYLLFAGCFSVAFVILQVLSGMLLTLMYTPDIQWDRAATLPSQVEFDSPFIPSLVISFLALGVAFGITRLFNKKAAE